MLVRLLSLLPLGVLSRLTGILCALRLPAAMRLPLLRWFCSFYGVRSDEAALPLDRYPSLADFFVRDLRPGLRPQGEGLTSPVDGTMRAMGTIDAGVIPQVKGWTYRLEDLLQDASLAAKFVHGSYLNLYLSPPDYHHVHMPLDGALVEMRYLPGKFWPVNDWALRSLPNLFCANERVLMLFDSARGALAVLMVGALNVAKISLAFDAFVSPQRPSGAQPLTRSYRPPLQFKKGDRLGTFHLGSTVVLLMEKRLDAAAFSAIPAQSKIRVGETLIY